ncbi:PH domain-containing protein [Streptomyces sp. NPDC059740]|uniref:PH domain-containing protein n=1 Tax=Streptomyces sp. NPDC059740 TaxID=3346926 RepID=UPI0036586F25
MSAAAVQETDWRGLDRRTLLVHCGWLGAPLGSLGLTALATGGRIERGTWLTLAGLTLAFVAVLAAGLVRRSRTAYRVTDEALEVRSGLLTRRRRSIPLHRVRTVDLTASPLHRLLGVTVLRAGTAGMGEGELALDALSVPEAERLRTRLLARAGAQATDGDPVVSRLNWRWLRYAPLTFWVVGGVLAVAGTVYRTLDGVGMEPWRLPWIRHAFAEFGASALWLTVPAALLGVLALGVLGALVLYGENWWGYRLEWTGTRDLRVRRGLVATRAVTVERARLRGVVLREPLLLRAGGGALLDAVAGGLGDREDNRRRRALLPPAPRDEALRTAAGVLRRPLPEPRSRPHPDALRRRRIRGLLLVVVPGTLALAVPGVWCAPVLLPWAGVHLVLAGLVARWLARDAYRSLRHGLDGDHLVVRSGTFSRDTVVLRRDAVVGWTFTDSPFGRRAGMVTLTAAVAAGEEGYRLRDLPAADAPAFAAGATPGVLEEFLAR